MGALAFTPSKFLPRPSSRTILNTMSLRCIRACAVTAVRRNNTELGTAATGSINATEKHAYNDECQIQQVSSNRGE